ncbi:MAG: tellurite resistance/C4-dicarboxylate transporter family protein [Colwellia sp.]|nr:tellurite resistance/C4-dicarboxylate transporter family protein [Colwellia sp.]MCW8863358.1 tellurite resistance/C4-dicarboxylate transporter family protein [Colwellia sp.]MCW9080441.1 tellurite resistance/C4-dicarboxylate transporter family protein [Colwellia sp.]
MSESRNWLKDLYPGYFAMTMATGIISIAFFLHNNMTVSDIFMVITMITWFVMIYLYTWRLIKYPKKVFENLIDPKTTFVFFTFVAATNLCGVLLHQRDYPTLAIICWFIAFGYWSILMYLSFTVLCFAHKDREVNIMHGGWLILIVGTQSLVLLGTQIAGDLGEYSAYLMVEIHMLWALGILFYAVLVTLFCYRIFFKTMNANDCSPLMWVIMGAAAISANAGTRLLLTDPVIPMLAELHAVIQLISIMLWTWATWWIPLLVIMGIWTHGYRKVPLKYSPMQWSIVFPLGMYTVATNNLALSSEFTPLLFLAHGMLWVALGAWLLLALALLKTFFNRKSVAVINNGD